MTIAYRSSCCHLAPSSQSPFLSFLSVMDFFTAAVISSIDEGHGESESKGCQCAAHRVDVGVDHAGHHHLALEIDHPGVLAGASLNSDFRATDSTSYIEA